MWPHKGWKVKGTVRRTCWKITSFETGKQHQQQQHRHQRQQDEEEEEKEEEQLQEQEEEQQQTMKHKATNNKEQTNKATTVKQQITMTTTTGPTNEQPSEPTNHNVNKQRKHMINIFPYDVSIILNLCSRYVALERRYTKYPQIYPVSDSLWK